MLACGGAVLGPAVVRAESPWLTTPTTPQWVAIPPPTGRSGHSAILDPIRHRMVVFGGSDDRLRDDVWALTLGDSPSWTELAPSGSGPAPRSGQVAVYDPVRDRMLIFGGEGSGYLDDVWALNLSASPAWSRLDPLGLPPGGRTQAAGIYDPVRDRLLIFGGYDGNLRNDVWALELSGSPTWSELSVAGALPAGRLLHTATYDPVRDRMIVCGGFAGSTLQDVWALSLSSTPTWTELSPGEGPTGRYGHSAVYVPRDDRIVVFGGNDSAPRNDVWSLALSPSLGWSPISPGGQPPGPRFGHVAILDGSSNRMMVFSGDSGMPLLSADLWWLSLSGAPAWSPYGSWQVEPAPRQSHSAILDPIQKRMVVFGGESAANTYRNDIWELALTEPEPWSQVVPGGVPPSPRLNHSAIYDPLRRRMVVFGGFDHSSQPYRDDVWALALDGPSTWSEIVASGDRPSGRFNHTAIYDPVRDRMIVFGGYDTAFHNDVWALSLGGAPAWSRLFPFGTPPSARLNHAAIYDPVRDRMVVFGGYGGTLLNDSWALTFSDPPVWSRLDPSGSAPSPRLNHGAIYDPIRDRLVVMGGFDGTFLNDVWALSLSGKPIWSEITPLRLSPHERGAHSVVYDAARDRLVTFGGQFQADGIQLLGDAWGLFFSAVVDSPPPPRRTAWITIQPNPARGQVQLSLEVTRAENLRVSICDLAGRPIREIFRGPLPPGRSGFTWGGRDRRGTRVPSGVYWVVVTAGNDRRAARLVWLND